MVTLHPQYVIDENQVRKAVVLSIDEWNRIIDDLEELDDIRAVDSVKAGPHDAVSFEQAVREIHADYKP